MKEKAYRIRVNQCNTPYPVRFFIYENNNYHPAAHIQNSDVSFSASDRALHLSVSGMALHKKSPQAQA